MRTGSMNVNRKAAQSEATRAKLVAAARPLFARRGYAAVGTEEIVRDAGVTRGALYHQFADKRGLFTAVVEQVELELAMRIAERAGAESDPVEALRAGMLLWLEACSDAEVQRIALLDAPAVLGFDDWRTIAERYGLGLVRAQLEHAMEAGAIARQPVAALAHVIIGALDEAALYLARAPDAHAARADMEVVLTRILDGLLPP